ncbi:MAG: DUF4271 domain-containing protein [Chitinophagia bacterium]|nr:DUF4271 domain-containing protein [Chitinophagia bacterium]
MRLIAIIWLTWGVFGSVLAQDSLSGATLSLPVQQAGVGVDSLAYPGLSDSVRLRLAAFPAMRSGSRVYGDAIGGYVEAHPYFPWLASPVYLISRERGPSGMDWLFYTLLGSLAFFGLLRRGFGRYLADLAVAFFDQAIRQAQIREQLARQALPAQLMNLQFLFNTALFAHLLAPNLRLPGLTGHGGQIGGFMLLAAAVYGVKSVAIWTAGYLSGKSAEAEGYLFIVMMVNKMAGIALIPMNILLAYLGGDFSALIAGVVLLLFSALFLFRLFRCYEYVNREFHIGLLAFLLFLASFEVMPVLVVGKLLLGVFSREMH